MTPVIFINCSRHPFVWLIANGYKTYETRTRNTLKSLLTWSLGERILIAETGKGKPVVRCSAVIDHVKAVYTRSGWDELRPDTQVLVGSEYDWKPNTKVKWLYHLTDVQPVNAFTLPDSCKRHGRVWAELNDFEEVSYWNSGGGVMCYCALYKGKYWIFGNEDYIDAYSIDVANEPCEHGGPDGKYDGDPNPYQIEDATDFPTWSEVLASIPDSCVGFYWETRKKMCDWYRKWQGGSLKKRVNEE